MARHPHAPTDLTRRTVRNLAAVGVPRETIAHAIAINPKTLERHYVDELAHGAAEANGKVAAKLFQQCMGDKGDMPTTVARLFWLKSRAKWKEIQGVSHEGPNGEALPPAGNAQVTVYLPDNGRDPHLLKTISPAQFKALAKPAEPALIEAN